MTLITKEKWYQAGLAFRCHQCGNCCSGPGEGYVWTTLQDLGAMAHYLKLSADAFKKNYVRRVGRRYSLIEKKPSNDCIFLSRQGQGIVCDIYPVRPIQCRTWPFWPENLVDSESWNFAAQGCAGINKGKRYSIESIEAIQKGQMETNDHSSDSFEAGLQWMTANIENQPCFDAVADIYRRLDASLSTSGGACVQSGNCCRFQEHGHRLYVSTLEMFYFFKGERKNRRHKQTFEPSTPSKNTCPYQVDNRCTARTCRPAGCRIYFCSGLSTEFQNEKTEDTLKQLRQLHHKFNVPYYYGDWTEWLSSGIVATSKPIKT